MNIDRDDAETWATWFKALGDPTRIVILNLLATAGRPMSVAEIVDAVDVGQSTVSHHLKILGDVRFLLVEREGTSSLVADQRELPRLLPDRSRTRDGARPNRCPVGHVDVRPSAENRDERQRR